MAEEARAAGDYETFHDLAWRAVQTRGQRDADLFFLLARAQSLSGRPHDALVTLRRLAQELRVAKDVTADDEFRRVRALPEWPEVRSIIAAAGAAPAAVPEPVGRTGREDPPAEPAGRTTRDSRPAEPTGRTTPGSQLAEPTRRTLWNEVARFSAPAFTAGGLAYDAVSRRFVIGNLPKRKLTIVEEGTNRAATLSGDAAQLLEVRALEIDRRRGDLWVVSEGSDADSGETRSELHKLQLVSGRVLTIYGAGKSIGRSRFIDVAVGGAGALVLDRAGPRLLRPSANDSLRPALDLPAGSVSSLAPADDGRTVYVAYTDHLARVDMIARRVERVEGEPTDVRGFQRLRWYKGSLVGVQKSETRLRVVQLRLSRDGTRVISARVLDDSETAVDVSTAIDLLEDEFFYLVRGAQETAIRRIRLK